MFWTREKPDDLYRGFEKIGPIENVLVAAWSVFEAYRKFGFSSEMISTVFAPGSVAGMATPYECIHVELKGPGNDTFNVTVGPAPADYDHARAAHVRLMNGIRNGDVTEAELQKAWEWSPVVNPVERFQVLYARLIQRGFLVPMETLPEVSSKGGVA